MARRCLTTIGPKFFLHFFPTFCSRELVVLIYKYIFFNGPESSKPILSLMLQKSSGGIHHLGMYKTPLLNQLVFKTAGEIRSIQQWVSWWPKGNSVDLLGVFLVPANCSTLLRQARDPGGGIFWGVTPRKSNIDIKNSDISKGVHLFQTIILGIRPLVFGDVSL